MTLKGFATTRLIHFGTWLALNHIDKKWYKPIQKVLTHLEVFVWKTF